jgi:hypothetical protein
MVRQIVGARMRSEKKRIPFVQQGYTYGKSRKSMKKLVLVLFFAVPVQFLEIVSETIIKSVRRIP